MQQKSAHSAAHLTNFGPLNPHMNVYLLHIPYQLFYKLICWHLQFTTLLGRHITDIYHHEIHIVPLSVTTHASCDLIVS